MRIAAVAERGRDTLVGLRDGGDLIVWDTGAGTRVRQPDPARGLASGRRLAVVERCAQEDVEIVCTIPGGFCTVSYALAHALELRFLPFERDTPLRLIEGHLDALAAAAWPQLPTEWLAAPAEAAASDGQPGAGEEAPTATAARAAIGRLRRVEGQARGVQRLIAEGRDYDQILTQLAAMRAAIQAVATSLLVERLTACLGGAGDDPDRARAIEAAKRAFRHFD